MLFCGGIVLKNTVFDFDINQDLLNLLLKRIYVLLKIFSKAYTYKRWNTGCHTTGHTESAQ